MTTITFNGVELTTDYIASDLQRPFFMRTVNLIEDGATDGQIFSNVNLDPIEISVLFTAISNDPQERSVALRKLAGALNVSQPAELYISDDEGKYYLAVPSGGESERYIGAERVQVVFTCPDPAMYGETKTITVPSGGEVSFEVGGNTYTYPTITANATRDESTYLWGLRLDEKDYIQVDTGASGEHEIELDCQNRTLTIDRTAALPTLSSDWLEFAPGEHTLVNEWGTGAATVTYIERWL